MLSTDKEENLVDGLDIFDYIDEEENILERILGLMQSDDDNTKRQSTRLKNLYENADKDGKELLDNALLCICGYTLKTLIKETE